MTQEELDSLSIQYTQEMDHENPPLYSNIHEREVRESERQQAYQDGFMKALELVILSREPHLSPNQVLSQDVEEEMKGLSCPG